MQTGSDEQRTLVVTVSDPSQLPSLRDWLRGQSGVKAALTPASPGEGEQGILDVVTVLASSSGLVAAIKVLPEFIKSRRSGFRIKTVVKGQEFTMEATNIDDLLPVLERLIGD